jgi:hypothetical protein
LAVAESAVPQFEHVRASGVAHSSQKVRTTKSKHGRTFVMTAELRALLVGQRTAVPESVSWVFPHRGRH